MTAELGTFMGIVALGSGVQILWAARHDFNPGDDPLSRAARLRDRGATDVPDYVVACICVALAVVLMSHLIAAVVGYALLCTTMALRFGSNLLVEERIRRRRAAMLGRRRAVDPTILVWIAVAALSAFLLVPSLAHKSDRAPALVVATCVVAMVAIAWRIATAPPLLGGEDLDAELQIDRMRRIRRSGMVCVIAIACASFYASTQERTIALLGYGALIVVQLWVLISIRLSSRSPSNKAPANG